ncbi:MAG: lipopolysaccharide heptosyltransferase II [Candidatus Omnitrophica bacterium]|nr:lipopolysaccharide heptosyltransferase II [Candidatus Omnitrophota bacterium]
MVIGCILKNWLGDVVFAAPAIRVIRNNFPTAEIICFVPERCVELLQANPYIDCVIPFDERGLHRSLFRKWRLISMLRRLQIDRVYLFHRSFTRALLFYLGGAKERIGYVTKGRGFLLTQPISEPTEKMHAVDSMLELLKRSGLQVTADALYEFYFDKSDLERVKGMIRKEPLGFGRLVALHPGANWVHKRWPWERFRDLAKELVRRHRVNVVITGGSGDREIAEKIVKGASDPRIISLCGATKLRELGALFSLCALVVSSDSGPLHIAGGVGTNVIGIFGPTDPTMTGPRGRGRNIVIHYVPNGERVPWLGKRFPKEGWMGHISTEEVLHTIEREKLL